MARLKRFIRPAILISVIGHLGVLATGLFFVHANTFQTVTPDAMEVDIVSTDEPPRLSGTPSDLRWSGSKVSPGVDNASPVEHPPTKPPAPVAQKSERRSDQPPNARPAKTPPGQPETAQAKTAQLGTALPDAAQAETAQPEMSPIKMEEPQPNQPEQQTEETPDQSETAERFVERALAGGRLGGGFQAPPVDALRRGYDFTAEFRERVSSCSRLPPDEPTDRTSIVLRVFFNRDGTLASPPQALQPIVTEKQQELLEAAYSALQKCQPYTMLPQDRYKDWKQLDLTFYRLNFFGD